MPDAVLHAPRAKRHNLLLVLDEFPQLGRMPTFETQMAAMAGYGLKAFIVCQSFNHITRAYGRDNVLLDNCHVVTAFAAADMETAKRIADMAGEVWEMRPQESEQRPRSLFGSNKGSITYKEERRPLMLPGDVRQLPRDEQLTFVSGMKPLRTKKLAFDREPIFVSRLKPSSGERAKLTIHHDWEQVAPLGRLPKEKKQKQQTPTAAPPRPQADLFEPKAQSISEQASAGLRPPVTPAPAAPPSPPQQTTTPTRPRHPQRTGV